MSTSLCTRPTSLLEAMTPQWDFSICYELFEGNFIHNRPCKSVLNIFNGFCVWLKVFYVTLCYRNTEILQTKPNCSGTSVSSVSMDWRWDAFYYWLWNQYQWLSSFVHQSNKGLSCICFLTKHREMLFFTFKWRWWDYDIDREILLQNRFPLFRGAESVQLKLLWFDMALSNFIQNC